VCAFRDPALRDEAACGTSDGRGIYRLETAAGSYYLAARGVDGDGFAFLGANPVSLTRGYYWVPLFLGQSPPPACRDQAPGGISGAVRFNGAPVAGAVVSVYPSGAGQTRGMGMLSASTTAAGRFSLDLEPGSYTVVARWRKEGGMGPPAAGDLFCYPAANPVTAGGDRRCELVVPCYPRDDLDRYLEDGESDPRGRLFGQRRMASLAAAGTAGRPGEDTARGGAAVSGRVTTRDGRPAAGMIVSAYPARGQAVFQMHLLRTRPAAMAVSGADGGYRLRLSEGGKYYIQARERTGEAVRPGELYGLYCGNANHSLTLAPGAERTAGITVARTMPEAARTIPPPPAGGGRRRLFLRDQVIRRDTVWDGEVTVDGVIVVAAGAHLFIRPGTTVRFLARDRNHDGVGDGEIRVLGGIRAEGTRERPVRFLAAEPGVSRWSYLLVYASPEVNVIRGCRFSGAFSGVQVHFSTAVVEDCVFTGNNEGIRFGRADIRVLNNRFTGNHVAVRFTRMEGPALISGNTITGNDTGVFLVPSGQNTTDFFDPERGGRPWNTGRLTIRDNTIAANRGYDVKLGARQRWDLDMRGNRWDRPRIFDHDRDPALGRVLLSSGEASTIHHP
jgi:hypothetical protein